MSGPVDLREEVSLLASLACLPRCYYEIASLVAAEDFSEPLHRAAWKALLKIVEQDLTPDVRSVATMLDPAGFAPDGVEDLLTEIFTIDNPTAALQPKDHARRVKDLADKRRIIAICEKAIARAQSPAVTLDGAALGADTVAEIQRSAKGGADDLVPISQIALQVAENLKKDLPCTPTGFECIDDIWAGGLYTEKLYGLGARQKAGKTSLMASISYNILMARARRKHAYFSLEMGPVQITERMMARYMERNSLAFMHQATRTDPGFIAEAADTAMAFADLDNLLFQHRPRMGFDEFRYAVANAALVHDVEGIIVDYQQLITGKGRTESTAEHLDNIAQFCAEACQKYGIWILMACQLNQEGNIRGGEGIKNACDMLCYLHKLDVAGRPKAWLEMVASRYTSMRDAGAADIPAIYLNLRSGPFFQEVTMDAQPAAKEPPQPSLLQ